VNPTHDERPHHKYWPRRLPRALVAPETSLWFNLEVSARRYPGKAACRFFGRTLSYRQLHDDAEALAGWLQSVGIRAGDRVLLFMQNCPQYIVAVYGILRANAVVVPVNPMNRADEFMHYISDPQARVAICSADLADIVDAANTQLTREVRLQHVLVTRYADAMPEGSLDPAEAPAPMLEQWLRSDPPLTNGSGAAFMRWVDTFALAHRPGAHTAAPDDLALLPYTSGTTGLP
jgi:fatty-acyl-CoA synthase